MGSWKKNGKELNIWNILCSYSLARAINILLSQEYPESKRPQGYVLLCKFRQLRVKIPDKLLLTSTERNIFLKKVLQIISADLLLFLELHISLHWAQSRRDMSWLTLYPRTQRVSISLFYTQVHHKPERWWKRELLRPNNLQQEWNGILCLTTGTGVQHCCVVA